MPFDPDDERAIVPCCGQPMCYCECNPWQRDYALVLQAALEYCPPAPPLPDDHPDRNAPPPF